MLQTLLSLMLLAWSCQTPSVKPAPISDQDRQLERIAAVAKELKAAGRGDFDYTDLGTFGWHEDGRGGFVGYYTLSPKAVAQTWRSSNINGVRIVPPDYQDYCQCRSGDEGSPSFREALHRYQSKRGGG